MILKDLINTCNIDSVINKLMELYPDQIDLKDKYINLLNRLKTLEPNMNFDHECGQLTLYVSHVEDNFGGYSSSYESVSGYSFLNNTSYACEFNPHADWLSMLIAEPSLNHYGIDAFLAHVLWEMSFVSFDDTEVEAEFDYIKALADEVREKFKENDTSNFREVTIPDEFKLTDDEKSNLHTLMELNKAEMHRMLGISDR